jgi:hypothetical protein
MTSFRYQRTNEGLGCLVSEDAALQAGVSTSDPIGVALERLEREAASLRAVAVSVTGPAVAGGLLERLWQLELPLCALLSPPIDGAALAFALRCDHRICVPAEGLRLRLADPGLPYLSESDGISVEEAVAAGLLHATASDTVAALALARTWASTAAGHDVAAPPRLGRPPAGTSAAIDRTAAGVRAASADLNGGFAARVFGSFLIEGLTLLGEGVPAAAIEEAAIDAGFATGPLAALDAAGLAPIDVALHRALDSQGHGHAHQHGHDHGHTHEHEHGHGHGETDHHHCCAHHGHEHGHEHAQEQGHGHAPPHAPLALPKAAVHVVEKMAHGFRRTGRAAGAGFYQYSGEGPAELWSGLSAFKRRSANAAPDEIRDRLVFAMAVEARRSLGGLPPRLGDIVSLFGCGFPLSTRGAVSFGTGSDSQAFDARCGELARQHGERFLPSAAVTGEQDTHHNGHSHEHGHPDGHGHAHEHEHEHEHGKAHEHGHQHARGRDPHRH